MLRIFRLVLLVDGVVAAAPPTRAHAPQRSRNNSPSHSRSKGSMQSPHRIPTNQIGLWRRCSFPTPSCWSCPPATHLHH